MQSILLQFQKHFSVGEDDDSSTSSAEKSGDLPKEQLPIFHPVFKLPITYLDETKIHNLAPSVSSDLELVISQSESNPMYDILFQPKHQFARELIPYWSKQYTSDIAYLEDTKQVIQTMPKYKESADISENLNVEKVLEIWKSVKEDEEFMDRYSYIDWNMLRYLNDSTSFLQIFSIAQIFSPIFSLLLPVLFFLVPFFILKIKGIDITIRAYMDMLKTITKGHFIGSILSQFNGPMSLEKIMYMLFFGAFYGFQIYQNIRSCLRFHLTITRINDHLFELKKYVASSLKKMETFSEMHCSKHSYSTFCQTTQEHCKVLRSLLDELSAIEPFAYSCNKGLSIGYMMKCYYRVYSVEEYGDALRYSMGFEGYLDNLMGVWENLVAGNVAFASLLCNTDYVENPKSKKHSTKFVEQYYPAHLGGQVISNTCTLDKNMIISAPNAAGKTTLLKSTAINVVFSQQVGCGFYKSGNVVPYTHIHSYLNIPDTSGRDSLFQAESRRCKEIIDLVSSPENQDARHFAILDELYSGTNPEEAGKSAYAFLKYLSKYDNVDFMLTTHYVYVCKKFRKSHKIRNYKMGVEYTDMNEGGVGGNVDSDPDSFGFAKRSKKESGGYKYTYKLEPGISKIQGAMKILKDMNYPQEMLDNIRACG
jgi:hypothetical protein